MKSRPPSRGWEAMWVPVKTDDRQAVQRARDVASQDEDSALSAGREMLADNAARGDVASSDEA